MNDGRAPRLLDTVAGLLLATVFVCGIAHVCVRLISGGGLIWFGDLSGYALAWIVMLGAAAVAFRGSHIAIDAGIDGRLRPGARQALVAIRLAAAVLFLGVLLYYSTTFAVSTLSQRFVTVRWLSLGWGTAALPVGATLMLVAVLVRGWRDLRARGERTERGSE